MENLWPSDIADLKIVTPKEILDKEAYWLGQATNNKITGEVYLSNLVSQQGNFRYSFHVVAPTLDDYHYRLFTVEYDMDIYPLKIDLDENLYQDLGGDNGGTTIKVEDEIQFKETLKKIFYAKRTRRIIGVLQSQIQNFDPPETDLRSQNIVEETTFVEGVGEISF